MCAAELHTTRTRAAVSRPLPQRAPIAWLRNDATAPDAISANEGPCCNGPDVGSTFRCRNVGSHERDALAAHRSSRRFAIDAGTSSTPTPPDLGPSQFMLPIVRDPPDLSRQTDARRPSFDAHAGSLLADTGTPVNVLISRAAVDAGAVEIGFFEFTLLRVPLLTGAIMVAVTLGPCAAPPRRMVVLLATGAGSARRGRNARRSDDRRAPPRLGRPCVPQRVVDHGVAGGRDDPARQRDADHRRRAAARRTAGRDRRRRWPVRADRRTVRPGRRADAADVEHRLVPCGDHQYGVGRSRGTARGAVRGRQRP